MVFFLDFDHIPFFIFLFSAFSLFAFSWAISLSALCCSNSSLDKPRILGRPTKLISQRAGVFRVKKCNISPVKTKSLKQSNSLTGETKPTLRWACSTSLLSWCFDFWVSCDLLPQERSNREKNMRRVAEHRRLSRQNKLIKTNHTRGSFERVYFLVVVLNLYILSIAVKQ